MKLSRNTWLFVLSLAAATGLSFRSIGPLRADDPPANKDVQQKLDAALQKADQLDKDGKHDDSDRIRQEVKRYKAKLASGSSGPAATDSKDANVQLEKARQRADQLDKEGKHDDADRIRREIKGYLARQTNSAPNPSSADANDVGRRLERMRERADQLDKDGKHEEADRLRQEIKAYAEKLSSHGKSSSESSARGANPSTKPVEMSDADRAKMREIRRQVAELEKDGKHEEAERLKQQAKEIYSKYYPQNSDGRSTRRPTEAASASPGEIANKLEHLKAAVENLRAAGFDNEANHIREIAEKLQRAGRDEGGLTRSSSTKPPSTAARTVSFGEQNLRELGSKDGHVLSKADFLASAKARGKDVSKAESSWNSLTGNKDSITLGEFQQKISAARQKADEKRVNP